MACSNLQSGVVYGCVMRTRPLCKLPGFQSGCSCLEVMCASGHQQHISVWYAVTLVRQGVSLLAHGTAAYMQCCFCV